MVAAIFAKNIFSRCTIRMHFYMLILDIMIYRKNIDKFGLYRIDSRYSVQPSDYNLYED